MTARKAAIALALEDGTDLADKINPRLVGLTLTEKREAKADEIEVRLQNADGRLRIPEPGVVLTLAMGWETGDDVPVGLVAKGRFTVDEVGQEGPPDVVTFKGRSADLTGDLRKRRTQSWRATTLGTILRTIAARHGRDARIESGFAAQAIEVIEQEGKSDMAFVADLGRRYDAIATWKDGKLIFTPIGGASTASGTALASCVLTKRDGWNWSFNRADRENYDGAEAQWHDGDAGRRRTAKVGGDNRRKLKRVYASESEAQQAAAAAASRAARAPFRFTYNLAIADPALQPDMRVTLDGWSEMIDGVDWLIESVRTDFSGNGLRQEIELESA